MLIYKNGEYNKQEFKVSLRNQRDQIYRNRERRKCNSKEQGIYTQNTNLSF